MILQSNASQPCRMNPDTIGDNFWRENLHPSGNTAANNMEYCISDMYIERTGVGICVVRDENLGISSKKRDTVLHATGRFTEIEYGLALGWR